MYERILIVIDEEATSSHALDEGLALAQTHDAAVVLLGVLPPAGGAAVGDLPVMGVVGYADLAPQVRQDAERRLQAADEAARRAGVRVQTRITDGLDPVDCIASTADAMRCDLIVVGSQGQNAVMRLLTGSVIPGLITRASVPVLVCRACSPGARTLRMDGTHQPAKRLRASTGPTPA